MRTLQTAWIVLIVTGIAAWFVAPPQPASAADLTAYPRASVHHYRHYHRHYAARPHHGYYFYHWGWRYGGTARSWYGSKFVFNDGYVWDGYLGW